MQIDILKNNRYIMVFVITSLLFFWHIPIIFDFASYDDTGHLLQHLSFIIVGMCIYIVIKKFDFTFLFLSFVVFGGVMGLYGFSLILSKRQFILFILFESHINAGNYMIILSIVMMIIILPLILIKKAIVHLNDDSSYQ